MKRIQKLVFISIFCALAISLDYIKTFIPFLNMPSGGSINIALIPVVICAFYLGPIEGIFCGLLWWLTTSIFGLNPYYISLAQYLVDYVIPSGIIGICSIFYKKKNLLEVELGILIMMIIRTSCLVISGALFWSEASAGSLSAWSASVIYNFPYCLATAIMLMIIVPMILRSLKKYML